MGTPAEYPRRRVLCDLSEAGERAMNKEVTPEGKKEQSKNLGDQNNQGTR